MKTLKLTLVCAAMAAMAVSCKPTEAGYKAAYDVAQAKMKNDPMADVKGFIREGDPLWRKVGNDSVLVMQQPLARLDGDSLPIMPVNVAVAAYRMKANAVAQADRLIAEGFSARVLRNRENIFYVIAAQYDSVRPVVEFIEKYMASHSSDVYSGLPGRPVVEIPNGVYVQF